MYIKFQLDLFLLECFYTNVFMKYMCYLLSSYIQYLDAYNLYGWAMSQKLPVNGFKWVNNEINEEFIKNCDENNNKGYILEVDVK